MKPLAPRRVLLRVLADAESAALAFRRGAGRRSVHDWRIAARRVGAWLRALEGGLGPEARRVEGRLRTLVSASNPTRDAESSEELLRDAVIESGPHAGLRALSARLHALAVRGRRRDAARLAPSFLRLAGAARRGLLGRARLTDFEEAYPAALRSAAKRLRRRLERVRGPGDEAALHRARIQAKRLRYLLEPYQDRLRKGRRAARRLRRLQDAIGELRDARRLRALLRPAAASDEGARRLRKRLKKRERKLFRRLPRRKPPRRFSWKSRP
ncbi:MAG TPA: CHAD domain-containing protein [Elusimicrobiota bacterium]|jgi:CHAD domain-containing protein|nr:CHAD domain-containing protein [Elusimicrobiota bacterium]